MVKATAMIQSIARRAFLNFRSSFSTIKKKPNARNSVLSTVWIILVHLVYEPAVFHAALGIYFDENVQKTISSRT